MDTKTRITHVLFADKHIYPRKEIKQIRENISLVMYMYMDEIGFYTQYVKYLRLNII